MIRPFNRFSFGVALAQLGFVGVDAGRGLILFAESGGAAGIEAVVVDVAA